MLHAVGPARGDPVTPCAITRLAPTAPLGQTDGKWQVFQKKRKNSEEDATDDDRCPETPGPYSTTVLYHALDHALPMLCVKVAQLYFHWCDRSQYHEAHLPCGYLTGFTHPSLPDIGHNPTVIA